MKFYYIVDGSVDISGSESSKLSFDGTKKTARFSEERPELGEFLTHEQAMIQTSTEFWDGPPPPAGWQP